VGDETGSSASPVEPQRRAKAAAPHILLALTVATPVNHRRRRLFLFSFNITVCCLFFCLPDAAFVYPAHHLRFVLVVQFVVYVSASIQLLR
jgi:hypothetical protein